MSYILGQSLDGFILMAYSEECSIISIEKQDFVILLTIFAHIPACARMCPHVPACARMCPHVPACARTFPHVPAFTSIYRRITKAETRIDSSGYHMSSLIGHRITNELAESWERAVKGCRFANTLELFLD